MWERIHFVRWKDKVITDEGYYVKLPISSIKHFLFTSTINCDYVMIDGMWNKDEKRLSSTEIFKKLKRFRKEGFEIVLNNNLVIVEKKQKSSIIIEDL